MSINITRTPQLFEPAYGPFTDLYYFCSSTNTTQPNFKFIFDLYTGSTATTSVARVKMFPKPTTTSTDYSPARVLESYVSYDLLQNIIGVVPQSGCLVQYYVMFGEEYGASATGTTIYPNLAYSSGYTWNSTLKYEQQPYFNWTNFQLSGVTGRFLTNAPLTQKIRANERASLSFLNFSGGNASYPTVPKYFRVRSYQNSGGSRSVYITDSVNTASTISQTTPNLLQHLGCGPWNFSQLTSNMLFNSSLPVINTNTDYKYDITGMYTDDNGVLQPCSSAMTYSIDTNCYRYQPVRFMWLNKLGGMDYFTALLVSRHTNNITRNTFQKVLPFNYVVGNRGKTVTDVDIQETVVVTTDWVTDAESTWLQEFFQSPEAYELHDDGTILPIIIDNASVEDKKKINDGLINYEFNYSYAYHGASQGN